MLLQREKVRWLLVLGIALVALILLSAGLSNLELHAGQPISLQGLLSLIFAPSDGAWPAGSALDIVWRIFSLIFVVLLPFAIVYFIVSAEARRRVIRDLAVMLSIALVFYAWVRAVRMDRAELGDVRNAVPTPAMPSMPTRADFAPDPSAWLVWLVSAGMAAAIAGLILGAIWYLRQGTDSRRQQIAHEAREALTDLRAGGDFKNVVFRCYAEMVRIAGERSGIDRAQGMTPREFEQRLEEIGFPRQDVQRLTRLFEDVRYGAKLSGEREEREAEACLEAVARASRRPA